MEIESENNVSTQPASLQKHKKRRLKKKRDLISMDSDHTKEEQNNINEISPQTAVMEQKEQNCKNKENSKKGEKAGNNQAWEDELLQEFYGLKERKKDEKVQLQEAKQKIRGKAEQKQVKKKPKKQNYEDDYQQSAKSPAKKQLIKKKNQIKEVLSKLIESTPENLNSQPKSQEIQKVNEYQPQIEQKSISQQQQQQQQQQSNNNDWLDRLKQDPLFAHQQSDEDDDQNLPPMALSSNMQALKRSRSEQINSNIIKTRNKFFKEIKFNKEDALWDINQNQLIDDFAPQELEIKEGQKIWQGIKQNPQNKKSFNQVFNRIKEWKKEQALLSSEKKQQPEQQEKQQEQILPDQPQQIMKKTPQEMKEFLNRSCSLLKNQGKDSDNEEVKLEIILPKMSNDAVIGNTLFINKMTRSQTILKNFQPLMNQSSQSNKSDDIKQQLKQQIKLRKSRNLTMDEVKKRFLITSLDDWEPSKKKQGREEEKSKEKNHNLINIDDNYENEMFFFIIANSLVILKRQNNDQKVDEKEIAIDNQLSLNSENNAQNGTNGCKSCNSNQDNKENKENQLDIEKIIELEEENEDESLIEDNDEYEDEEQDEENEDQEEEQNEEQEQEENSQNEEQEQEENLQNQQNQYEQQHKENEQIEQQEEQKQQKLKKLRTVAQKIIDKKQEEKAEKEKRRLERAKQREQQERLARNPKTKEALRKMLEMEAELGSDQEDHDDIVKQIDHNDESERESNAEEENKSNNSVIDDLPLLPSENDSQAVWEKFQQDILDQEKLLLQKVLKGSFKGQKRTDDMIELYDNEFTKRKLQMVQERIKELDDKDQNNNNYNPEDEDERNEKQRNEGSLFSDDDDDQERQHLLQVEMELKRKILTEHPIKLDDQEFVDPEIMKKVVYLHPYQERDTFGKLMTPKKTKPNNTQNLLTQNSSQKKLINQQQKPYWSQQSQQSQLSNQIFTQSNYNRNSVLALRMDKRQISRFNSQIMEEDSNEIKTSKTLESNNNNNNNNENEEIPGEQPKLKKQQSSFLNQLFVSGTPNKVTQIQHMLRKTPVKNCFSKAIGNNNNNNNNNNNHFSKQNRPRSIFSKQY